MDELRYICSNFVRAKNNVDIDVPVIVIIIIKAFTEAKITADNCSAKSSDSDWLLMSVHMHPCSMKPSWPFSALMQRRSQFLWFLCFGGLSDCRICGDCACYLNSKGTVCTNVFDAFVCVFLHCHQSVCVFLHCHQSVCVGFFQHLSPTFDFQCFVSSSSLFFLFQCFVGDICLLDSCTLSAACAYTWSECNFI